jgi:hypothetical protein
MRAGGLGESMWSCLAHGAGLGDSLPSGLGPGTGRGGSILPALGRWAKIITTPTGNGEGGLKASFRERAGLKFAGLSDALSTPRNLENILQQKEEVKFTKEVEEVKAARTAGGGEWEDLMARVHGYNYGGVEWMVSGGDWRRRLFDLWWKDQWGGRFCTENADCMHSQYPSSFKSRIETRMDVHEDNGNSFSSQDS